MKKLVLLLAAMTVLLGCTPAPTIPQSIPAIDPGVDPSAWVQVPAGEFLMGLNANEMAVENDYEIMVTDVTTSQYAGYLNEALGAGVIKREGDEILGYYPGDEFRGFRHEEEIAAGDWLHVPLSDLGLRIELDGTFLPMSGYENHPMTLVTWFGAKSYCEFYGWRLPTEMEWEKAARGTDGRPYPWGDSIVQENANYYSSHDLFEKIAGGLGDTTPVGFYNGGVYAGYQTLASASPYGLYDMAGNVWQWTGDVYPDQHYRYMRGGSKDNYAYNLRVWTRNSAGPEYYSPSVGFRCVRE